MEIKAGSVYDAETMTAFSRYMIYKKKEPRKSFTLTAAASAALAIIASVEMVVFGFDTLMLMAIIVMAVFVGLAFFLYFALPAIQYKGLSKMRDAKNEFVFYDAEMTVKTVGDGLEGEVRLSYDGIFKAAEFSHYLIIYQDKVRALIVDRETMDRSDAETVLMKLREILGDKYVKCKY